MLFLKFKFIVYSPKLIKERAKVLFLCHSRVVRVYVRFTLKCNSFFSVFFISKTFLVFEDLHVNDTLRFQVLKKRSGIYLFFNKRNHKIYIGSAVDLRRRLYSHLRGYRSNKKLQNAFKKYGLEKFTFLILEIVLSEDSLIIREQFFLDLLRPDYNFNKIAGSNFLGVSHASVTRLTMSTKHKGDKNPMFGRTGEKNPMFGKSHSWTTRNKIRELTPRAIKVIVQDLATGTEAEYASIRAASEGMGCSPSTAKYAFKKGSLIRQRFKISAKR